LPVWSSRWTTGALDSFAMTYLLTGAGAETDRTAINPVGLVGLT